MEKKYNVGLVLGRFQPLHIGHEAIIREALKQCEQVVVAIGSAQKQGVPSDPLSWQDRRDTIISCFSDEYYSNKLLVMPLSDRENYSNDSSFGEYIMSNVFKAFEVVPDVIFEGAEAVRKDWYNTLGIDVIQIDRGEIKTSGTQLREAIKNGEKDYIDRYTATNAGKYHYKIKEVLTKYD